MRSYIVYIAAIVLVLVATVVGICLFYPSDRANNPTGYTGSVSCRQCHEEFYRLWATSHHGLAMQPYTPELAANELQPLAEPIQIGDYEYTVELGPGGGLMRESKVSSASGVEGKLVTRSQTDPNESTAYCIAHALGGRNIYYFLTPMERGRLQTLPLAYDLRRQEWFETAKSAVRHFPGGVTDSPLEWTDQFYTFNTSCHSCHVSQLSTNYDPATDSYFTTWAEPGINCETCHGPGGEHVKTYLAAAEQGREPENLNLISARGFNFEQTNSQCASCHAKLSRVSPSFGAGERYFDHFDLIGFEHQDFYPDGRDLGENYTYTLWRMSPCVKSGQLDCMHCHTSSGRYRFAGPEPANDACLPCHAERVANATEHTHHAADSEGNKCIACHMPTTEFARMTRSDHSMKPPTPATTLAFESPNACNMCHADEDAEWADKYVRQWHEDDYQRPVLELGNLIKAARAQDWGDDASQDSGEIPSPLAVPSTHLDDILDYIGRPDRDEMFATSLIRLLRGSDSQKQWPVLIDTLQKDPSPLVRSAAADVLAGHLTDESIKALLEATRDEYRLVRVRAATSLARVPTEMVPQSDRQNLAAATAELKAALGAYPDDYVSHYNLGNFHMDRQEYTQAITAFETAIKLRADYLPPYVNASLAYNTAGQNDKAETSLQAALSIDPNCIAANLNLAMLLAEQNRLGEAETAFRDALKSDPNSAVAAYNLGVMLAKDNMPEALKWCRKASALQPDNHRYVYTYAFYLRQSGSVKQAIEVLKSITDKQIPYAEAYFLLGDIYEQQQQFSKARDTYSTALALPGLPEQQRYGFAAKIRQIQNR